MSTPQDQIRASIAMTHAVALGERLLQADKANPSYKLSDLRCDNERAVYIDAAASFLLDQAGRLERIETLNQIRSHGHALADHEAESVMVQARKDAAFFGDPIVQAFMTTNPRFCPLCRKELLYAGRATVQITEGIAADAHGLCMAMHPSERFEFISEGSYKLIEVRR